MLINSDLHNFEETSRVYVRTRGGCLLVVERKLAVSIIPSEARLKTIEFVWLLCELRKHRAWFDTVD